MNPITNALEITIHPSGRATLHVTDLDLGRPHDARSILESLGEEVQAAYEAALAGHDREAAHVAGDRESLDLSGTYYRSCF